MTTDEAYLNRRAFPRHQIRDSSTVMLSPAKIISFSVLDVSKTGIAFSYNGRGIDSEKMDQAVLDLFGETIVSFDLPAKVVSDSEIDKENVWFTNEDEDAEIPYLRRCGIEFGKLSESQELAIEKYIQSLESRKVYPLFERPDE